MNYTYTAKYNVHIIHNGETLKLVEGDSVSEDIADMYPNYVNKTANKDRVTPKAKTKPKK